MAGKYSIDLFSLTRPPCSLLVASGYDAGMPKGSNKGDAENRRLATKLVEDVVERGADAAGFTIPMGDREWRVTVYPVEGPWPPGKSPCDPPPA